MEYRKSGMQIWKGRGEEHMGLGIYLAISKAVTREEWEKVYEETLQLVKAFPLADRREVECRGIPTICLTHSEEREFPSRWNETKIGWCTEGDLETLRRAEDYFLPRDLIGNREVYEDAGDALLGILPDYIDMKHYADESWRDGIYYLWGNKTQGEPYHLCLLAIACLIETRLGEKAIVYGDINRKQCVKALGLMDSYLEEPLKEPVEIATCCDMEKLWERVYNLYCDPVTKIQIFEHLYIGEKKAPFGEFLRRKCSKEAIETYWKDRFRNFCTSEWEQERSIREYLLRGFSLEKLCRLVDYSKYGEQPYEKFIRFIMDTKMYMTEAEYAESMEDYQEELTPFFSMLSRITFDSGRKRRIERYIPMEEIREALNQGLKEKCDVDSIMYKYLKEEAGIAVDCFENEDDFYEIKDFNWRNIGTSILESETKEDNQKNMGTIGLESETKEDEPKNAGIIGLESETKEDEPKNAGTKSLDFEKKENQEKFKRIWGMDAEKMFTSEREKNLKKQEQPKEKYDIEDYRELLFYEKGESIHPGMKENLQELEKFYRELLQEEEYDELLEKSRKERCEWLQENNRSIVIRDTDWEKIYTEIEESKEAFARYYPVMRVQMNSDAVIRMSRAYMINDDLYELCKEF